MNTESTPSLFFIAPLYPKPKLKYILKNQNRMAIAQNEPHATLCVSPALCAILDSVFSILCLWISLLLKILIFVYFQLYISKV
ncbi:hypothetical protein ACQP3J_31110, partial [Escherichia coli]